MRSKFAFILAIACLFSGPAFAQGSPSNANGSLSADSSSWVAGGQLGYNWQRDWLLYGLEADLSGMDLKSEKSGALSGPATADLAAKVDWYGTLRGRLGWAAGPWLVYGTGGLAYGKVDLNSGFSVTFPNGAVPGSLNTQTSPMRTGWVAGGGAEYLLRPNVTLGVEYEYIDLGTVSLASSTAFASGLGTVSMAQSARVHAAFQVLAASLNWHSSPATRAGPWEGFYVGGQAGGAWGNDASADYSAVCNSCGLPSDVRLKRDFVLVGRLKDGLGIYRYRYLWCDAEYVGVMAQEVALVRPDAIVHDPFGYLLVVYSKLGLRLMTAAEWHAVQTRSSPHRASFQFTMARE